MGVWWKFGRHSVSKQHKRIYYIWHNMLRRCTKPTDAAYKHYGAKGVTVYAEWLDGPTAFCEWALANGYQDGLTIDRIDPAGPYSPDNCRWIPMELQHGNRRNRATYTAWGETKPVNDWFKDSRCVVTNRKLINHRVRILGWIPERAMSTPALTDHKTYCARGERHNSKLTAEIVHSIRKEVAAGATLQSQADKYGVCLATVAKVRDREIWAHV